MNKPNSQNALETYLRNTLLDNRSDITQEKMAEQLNITPRALSNIECGYSTFGLHSFLRFYLRFLIDKKENDAFWQDIEKIIDELDESA